MAIASFSLVLLKMKHAPMQPQMTIQETLARNHYEDTLTLEAETKINTLWVMELFVSAIFGDHFFILGLDH